MHSRKIHKLEKDLESAKENSLNASRSYHMSITEADKRLADVQEQLKEAQSELQDTREKLKAALDSADQRKTMLVDKNEGVIHQPLFHA
jgi:DNA repair ATPase RecN